MEKDLKKSKKNQKTSAQVKVAPDQASTDCVPTILNYPFKTESSWTGVSYIFVDIVFSCEGTLWFNTDHIAEQVLP